MTRYGLDVTIVHPPGFDIDPEVVGWCKKNAEESGGHLRISNDYSEALNGAHAVFPRSWVSQECVMRGLGDFGAESELAIHEKHKDWTLTQKQVDCMDKHAVIMHVMPVYRGMEAADEVIDGEHSAIIDQAENRLYAQMAVLTLTMSERP
jgi:ornithine carbamoyltransferase